MTRRGMPVRWRPRSITNKQMLLMKSLNPSNPPLYDRSKLTAQRQLFDFHVLQADGQTFLPVKEQPPWRRSMPIVGQGTSGPEVRNYQGIRVALVDKDDEPGFPTHFR